MNNIETINMASPLQVRLLSDPSHPSATVQARHRLGQQPDREAVRRAWDALVASEPTLRSCFVWQNVERPVQVVYRTVETRLSSEDSSHEWHLSEPRLVECALTQTPTHEHYLTVRAASVLLDETSVGLVLDNLLERLDSGQKDSGEHDSLDHHLQFLKTRDERAANEWWNQLGSAPALGLIPRRNVRGPVRRKRRTIRVPLDHVLKIEKLAARLDVPLHALLLAAWAFILSRLGNTTDVLTGLVMDGRPQPYTNWIGRFRALLPIRVTVPLSESLSDLINICMHTYRTTVQHCWLPPSDTIDVGTSVTFIEETRRRPRQPYEAHAPLEIRLRKGAKGAELEAIYQSPLFSKGQIAEIMILLAALLENLPSVCAAPMREVQLLSGDLRRRVIKAGSSALQRSPVWEGGVLTTLDQYLGATPSAAVIISDTGALSCIEVQRRVNGLARYLLKRGAVPETVVALLLSSPSERIIWELAVLKAGAAFLPVDPKIPAGRLRYVLEDSGALFIIAESEFREFCDGSCAQVICPQLENEAIALESSDPLPHSTHPDSLAYIMYTSGSTGVPKGVAVHHGGLHNMAVAHSRRFGKNPAGRTLQFASAGFDASVWELFGTLQSGGALCLPDSEAVQVGSHLHATLKRMHISQVTLPPSALRVLDPEDLPELTTLVSAGEECSLEIVNAWTQNGCVVWNAYGPTEVTVCASMGRMQPGHPVHLGLPIDGFSLYVLDGALEPVPFGVVGELYIAGPGLARGYWKRPGFTADRFVPDPFSTLPGTRMYRSGDRVLRQRDGRLLFLGRADRQIKVRGFRIEPEEIERTLITHPEVEQAAVVVTNDHSESRIAAYIVEAVGDKRAGPVRHITIWPSVTEHFVYDDLLYRAMLDDVGRMEFYRSGLRNRVAGKIAVDIGTGPEATLARICIEEGARKVYAIELLDDSARRARALVERLGLSNRIVVIQGSSQTASLPEPAEVCVSGLVGPIGGVEGVWNILREARLRLLKPAAQFVPTRIVTMIGAVSIPRGAETASFSDTSSHYVEKIFSEAGRQYPLRLCLNGISPDDIVSSTAVFEDLDFQQDHPYEWTRSIQLVIKRPAQIDGLLLWLNLDTTDAARIDTLATEHCWLPVFFPVFWPAIDVTTGDDIRADCIGKTSENGVNPDYSIKGVILRRGKSEIQFDYDSPHRVTEALGRGFYASVMPGGRPRVHTALLRKSALKAHLESLLPPYMVPSDFIFLNEMPLTSNGKIDYARLLKAEKSESTQTAAPESDEEKVLTEIWSTVLPGRRFGVTDNFFDVGGTSLLAAEVQIHLSSRTSHDLPLVDILKYPTIRSLAERLRKTESPPFDLPVDQLQAGRRLLIERADRHRA